MTTKDRFLKALAVLVVLPIALVPVTGCNDAPLTESEVAQNNATDLRRELNKLVGENLYYNETINRIDQFIKLRDEYASIKIGYDSEKQEAVCVDLKLVKPDHFDTSDEARYDIEMLPSVFGAPGGIKVTLREPAAEETTVETTTKATEETTTEATTIEETTTEETTVESTTESTLETTIGEQDAINAWLIFLEGTWDGEFPYKTEDFDGNEVQGTIAGSNDFKQLVDMYIQNGIPVSIEAGTGALVISPGVINSVDFSGFTIYKIDENTIKVVYPDTYVPNEYTYTRTP